MSLQRSGLSLKISTVIGAVAISSALAGGGIMVHFMQAQEVQSASEKLDILQNARKTAVEQYIGALRNDLSTLASSDYTRRALYEFRDGWSEIGNNPTKALQAAYIQNNSFDVKERAKLDQANDGSAYTETHARYNPWFRNYLEQKGYSDLYVFDRDGNVIYSVKKKADFATNVTNGLWQNSKLTSLFKTIKESSEKDVQVFEDFFDNEVSNFQPAALIGQAIFTAAGNFAGMVAIEITPEQISKIMHNPKGLGISGETYLVGADGLRRSESRFRQEWEESTILKSKANEISVSKALSAQNDYQPKNHHIITNQKGEEIITAYGTMNVLGHTWISLAEINKAETVAPAIEKLKYFIAIICGAVAAIMLAGIGITQIMIKRFARSLQQQNSDVLQNPVSKVDVHAHDRETKEIRETANAIAKSAYSIKSLSEQTKLVALNASLEAKKFGAQDKGFNALISKLKTLANDTKSEAAALESQANKVTSILDKNPDGSLPANASEQRKAS